MAQYNQVTPEIIEQLKLAAPDHVFTGADINEDYMRDECRFTAKDARCPYSALTRKKSQQS